jgi:predicted Zn finger-like uncharacterized protein
MGAAMSTIVNCPGCNTAYNLADEFLGKKVRCRNCQYSFPTSAADAAADQNRLDVVAVEQSDMADDGLQSDVRVVKPAAARRIADDEDGDRPSTRREDDRDDEFDDVPPPKKSGVMLWLLLGGGAAAADRAFTTSASMFHEKHAIARWR